MPRKPKRKAEPGVKDDAQPSGPEPKQGAGRTGGWDWQLASQTEKKPVEWLCRPWIPRAMLTLVVGHPNVGKSTFLAWLMAHETHRPVVSGQGLQRAGRVVLLPGHEEEFEVMTLPRLLRAGVKLDRVKVLQGGSLSLVRDRDRLSGIVDSFGATLIIGDPIDSYVDDGFSEDRGQDVRPMLEAAARIGKDTGAAVVFARHPGKDPNNILPGSRQWRAVPRIVVQLTSDGHHPPKLMISHYKDSLGTDAAPRRYALMDDGNGPRLFKLEEEMDRSAEELAKAVGGPIGRWKLMQACRLIRWIFAENEKPERQKLGYEGKKQGLGEDTINEAMRLLGVRSIPGDGRDAPWMLMRMQEQWPAWLPEVAPP